MLRHVTKFDRAMLAKKQRSVSRSGYGTWSSDDQSRYSAVLTVVTVTRCSPVFKTLSMKYELYVIFNHNYCKIDQWQRFLKRHGSQPVEL